MAIHPSLSLRAARRNTLAACLAVALAAGGAIAGSTPHSADAPRAYLSSDEAIFGALHTTRVSGAKNGTRDADLSPLAVPTRPAGATITVTNCLDDGSVGSLRWAFTSATEGDLIDLHALTCPDSTIMLSAGAIVATDPNLSVLGPGQDVLTVQADDTSRVFQSINNYGLEISDLTIANGGIDNGVGGCIFVGGDLTLTRSTVTGCRAGDGNNTTSFGGGVDVIGNLTLHSSTIRDSSSLASDRSYGGAAYVYGDAHLDNSTIEGNDATAKYDSASGGGLFVKGDAFLYGSRLIGNEASSTDGTAFGGGLFSATGATTRLSTIRGNTAHSETASSYGGGIHSDTADNSSIAIMLITSTLSGNTASAACDGCRIMGGGASSFGKISARYSTIRDNQVLSAADSAAMGAGGGLATYSTGDAGRIDLVNSTVSGNSAHGGENGGAGYGGGIAAISSSPFVAISSTIAFNYASHSGGGAIGHTHASYMPKLYSSIVANNVAPNGADIAPSFPLTPFTIEGSNNLVMTVSVGITLPDGTIIVDPLLLPLDEENGGLTTTHALDANSPAIDVGSNTQHLTYDQRHCPYVREAGGTADIGAFELQTGLADHIFGDDFDGGMPLCP